VVDVSTRIGGFHHPDRKVLGSGGGFEGFYADAQARTVQPRHLKFGEYGFFFQSTPLFTGFCELMAAQGWGNSLN
jgi:hypothetical protein